MQKILRAIVVLLLIVAAIAVVYSRTQLYAPPHAAAPVERPLAAPRHETPVEAAPPAAAASPSASVLGTDAMPVAVRVVPGQDAEALAAERAEERQILQGIRHSVARIAATGFAENFLQWFQAIICFFILIVLYMLMEKVKKIADAASQSTEAARQSAELAQRLADRKEKHRGLRKFPPHFYRKR